MTSAGGCARNLRRRAALSGVLGAVLLSAPAARAAAFHLVTIDVTARDASAGIIEDGETSAQADGVRQLTVDKVLADFIDKDGPALATLDQITLAFNCQARTYRVVSEYLYLGLSASSEKVDKSDLSKPGWKAFQDGSEVGEFFVYACVGPSGLKHDVTAFERSDRWSAASLVADFLQDQHAKEAGK